MSKQNKKVHRIRVDEDGALARSSEFLKVIFQQGITIETTSGCRSISNAKIERPIEDNHNLTRVALTIANLPPALWYFARQHDVYVLR